MYPMATELAVHHGYGMKPSVLVNYIFMSTVNTAAKTLVAVASSSSGVTKTDERWRAMDHVRFMAMLMTWLAVWVLRLLMDYVPCSLVGPFSKPLLLLDGVSTVGSHDYFSSPSSSSPSLELVQYQELESSDGGAPLKGLGRSITHIIALLNEIPASSRKYQFALAMADKILDENARSGHVELIQINRTALAAAFARTSSLLHRSLRTSRSQDDYSGGGGGWTSRIIRAMPFGSLVSPYLKGLGFCLGSVFPSVAGGDEKQSVVSGGEAAWGNELMAEKHAQELLWITNKMRGCGAMDEALVQWSLASGLASLSLTASPRVQGFIVKISAILMREISEEENMEVVGRAVKFKLLVLWLPLLCYAENGLAYPVLTGYEKVEMERIIDQIISSLPSADQEVILTNWLQDFTISTSDWPNLLVSYDRWCHVTRKLIA